MLRRLGKALIAALVCGAATAGAAVGGTIPPVAISFNRDIRPILSDACFQCHGPDRARRKGNLRLDTEDGLRADRGAGTTILSGEPGQSELLKRINAIDADEKMPPPDSHRTLTPAEAALIAQWVVEGAKWEPHWAFVPPRRPAIPADNPAAGSLWRGSRHPIDRFVNARLARAGLAPNARASRSTLLRRLSLDLTGLPPSLAEQEHDSRMPPGRAFAASVDRLLASPAFGERMAIEWMYAARYADTNGYQKDSPREMWRWRDWVIDAFNHNMPFDKFSIEQIAGDQMPGATLSQQVASGFNRNHRTNDEGGIIAEEYRVEYVIDRVETMGTVWLGMTLGCARCHDHKYDPLRQEDFYRLFAFFNNVSERGRAGGKSIPPFIKAPSSAQARHLQRLAARQQAAARLVAALAPERAFERWLRTADPAAMPVGYTLAEPARWFSFDKGLGDATGALPPASAPTAQLAPGIAGQALDVLPDRRYPLGPLIHIAGDDRFTLSFWLYPRTPSAAVLSRMLSENSSSWRGGFGVFLDQGHVQFALVNRWLDDCLRIRSAQPVVLNRWHHVAVTYDGSQTAAGVQLYVDGVAVDTKIEVDELVATALPGQGPETPLVIGHAPDMNHFDGRIDELRFYARRLSAAEVAVLAAPEELPALAAMAPDRLNAGQRAKLHHYFLNVAAPPPLRRAHANWRAAVQDHDRFLDSIPTTMVMAENAKNSRATHILARGQYDQPGAAVSPGLPPFLTAAASRPDTVSSRLELARWLVSRDNPLTARVAVNRIWQMLFGVGLVKSAEDFGVQGDPPSIPELLDWLAIEFMDSGWNIKRLIKLILSSATYQRSSHLTAIQKERDPDNRLLARAPRFRMSAEIIRDQALAIGGLLRDGIGGPSVAQGSAGGGHRRALYRHWQRTKPPVEMTTFDAPSRETCSVRWSKTNTPLQALALLNDPAYLSSARAMVAKILGGKDDSLHGQIGQMFRTVLARPPSAAELELAEHQVHLQAGDYFENRADARRLAPPGGTAPDSPAIMAQRAALVALASTLLNLDETINRE